jgi:methylglutaconyl-CoA hydratase
MTVADGVKVEISDDGASFITLVRPETRNALSPDLVNALTSAIIALGEDSGTRLLVLGSEGRSFSSGGDLDSLGRLSELSYEENLADGRVLDELFRALDTCPCPVITKVQGPALGGGSALVACADIAIASDNAVFGLTEVRFGLVPAIVAPYVARKIGTSASRRYLVSGERFNAIEALRIGLIHEVVTQDELEDRTATIVVEMLAGYPQAQRATKSLLRMLGEGPSPEETLRLTSRASALARTSEEAQKGIQAFLNKIKLEQ